MYALARRTTKSKLVVIFRDVAITVFSNKRHCVLNFQSRTFDTTSPAKVNSSDVFLHHIWTNPLRIINRPEILQPTPLTISITRAKPRHQFHRTFTLKAATPYSNITPDGEKHYSGGRPSPPPFWIPTLGPTRPLTPTRQPLARPHHSCCRMLNPSRPPHGFDKTLAAATTG